MSSLRGLGCGVLVAFGLALAACEPEGLHPREEAEEAPGRAAPSEDARDEVREQDRREELPEEGEGR